MPVNRCARVLSWVSPRFHVSGPARLARFTCPGLQEHGGAQGRHLSSWCNAEAGLGELIHAVVKHPPNRGVAWRLGRARSRVQKCVA